MFDRPLARPSLCWPSLLCGIALVASACSSQPDDDAAASSATATSTTVASSVASPTTDPPVSASQVETTASADVTIAPLDGTYAPSVVATFPHDAEAYTQGLEVMDGRLIESTGRYEQSQRRVVELETGEVLDEADLPADFFGEGITRVGDELVQITWQSERFIVADASTLDEVRTGTYTGQGWGLCFDGSRLVMSDGSNVLTFRDVETFEPTGTIEVRRDGQPVELLNELECVNGQVFANVYGSDEIVVVDPATGEVAASIDASSLRPADLPVDDLNYALNGIAFDQTNGRFYLTGKLWPVLFAVDFVPS